MSFNGVMETGHERGRARLIAQTGTRGKGHFTLSCVHITLGCVRLGLSERNSPPSRRGLRQLHVEDPALLSEKEARLINRLSLFAARLLLRLFSLGDLVFFLLSWPEDAQKTSTREEKAY